MNTFNRFLILVLTFVILLYTSLFAQPFSLDTTFQSTYVFRNFIFPNDAGNITSLFEMEDGSLRLGGGFQDPFDNTMLGNLVKLNSNGQFDSFFGYGGSSVSIGLYFKKPFLYIKGTLNTLFRVDYENCEIDTVFDNNRLIGNWGYNSIVESMYFPPEEDFSFVSGTIEYMFDSTNIRYSYIARIHENGVYDTSFHHDANYAVKYFFRYDSTRTILTGTFTAYDGVPRHRIARIFNDGALDSSFNSVFVGNSHCWLRRVYTLEDGKMLVGGAFQIAGYDKQLALIRLLPNGDLDTSFNNFDNVQSPFNGLLHPDSAYLDKHYQVIDIIKTSNNKLLIGGSFWNYQGHYKGNIALTDENGYIDTTVFTGSGIDTCLGNYNYFNQFGVNCIVPAQNNKYYVAGKFSGFNGQMVEPIIRLNPHDHVGIVKQEDEQDLLVYPNPAKESLVLQASSYISNAEVFSIKGHKVKEIPIGGTQKRVDVSVLPPGNYIIHATGRDNVWVEKFVVMR